MIVMILLLITTAVSLPYFSVSSIESGGYWRRLVTALLICTLPLVWESRWTSELVDNIILYNGLMVLSSNLNIVAWLLILTTLTLVTVCSPSTSQNTNGVDNSRERTIFILCTLLGGIILSSSADFLTIFLGLELQSYSVYILAASYRQYEPSEAAGLKYFLLGALSSALVFMGLAVLYTYSGSTNLYTISTMMVQPGLAEGQGYLVSGQILPLIGLVLVFSGIAWKVAAAPVHAWSIDVYDAVPTRTTAVLSLVPKIALFTLLIRLISMIAIEPDGLEIQSASALSAMGSTGIQLIGSVVILSLLIGSIVGLLQPRMKRLLAYSSVLNVGFILMIALLCNTSASGITDYFNPLMYVIQYILTTAAVWLCLINLASFNTRGPLGQDEEQEVTMISQLQGLHTSSYAGRALIATCLTVLILSTAGIPPMVGFLAKYEAILLAVKTGYMSLALVAVLASLISTVYYLGVVRSIWARSSAPSVLDNSNNSFIVGVHNSHNRNSNNTTGLNPQLIGAESTILIALLTLVAILYAVQHSVVFGLLSL